MNYPKADKHIELKDTELRWKCKLTKFDFTTTEELKPLEGILGQERALQAIKLGVHLKSPGYNIYIAGLSGTGKATTVKQMLEDISKEVKPVLKDYAYVYNFKDPDRPMLLIFDKGEAKKFKSNLSSAVSLLRKKIPQALETDTFISKKNEIIEKYKVEEDKLTNAFEQKLKEDNFTIGEVKIEEKTRTEILPIIKKNAVPIAELDDLVAEKKLSGEEAQKIFNKYNYYVVKLQELYKKSYRLNQDFEEKVYEIEKEAVTYIVQGIFDDIAEDFPDPKIKCFLDDVNQNILNNLIFFKGLPTEGQITQDGLVYDYFKLYEINIVMDNSDVNEIPIIIETSPNYINLFGTIERVNDDKGGFYSDFSNIKGGSLLRANGGFLVINVNHLFEEPYVWKSLKRILTYRLLEIQDHFAFFQMNASTLKPEPIPIDCKVILLGSQNIYSLLAEYEYDFKKIFKVKADFDFEIKRTDEVLVQYARVIKKLITQENLLEFDISALAYLIELSARLAGKKNKLITRFSKIADIAREASFWASDEKSQVVSSIHVQRAFAEMKERHGLLENKVSEMFEENMILIDVEGTRIGQINGLAVYGSDFYSFGRPTRITATVSLGSGSIINVEREAGMSGRHYNKGVLIISGYFRETFGQDLPLSFNANLVFEQSYGTVDGDSASCAEIFALLSTLAGVPINQSIAVTGSLNQKGDVQPIGGVNEKIEGFYDVCKMKNFTGKQGVIIPVQNVQELMLREDIIDSVKKGEFHIYPIEKVEQGIEILTGIKSGDLQNLPFKENTIYYLVEKKIRELYEKARNIRQSPRAVNEVGDKVEKKKKKRIKEEKVITPNKRRKTK